MRRHWLTAVGVLVTAVGVAMLLLTSPDPAVPNDPNIGAGVVFVAGVMTIVGGVAYARGR